MTENYTYYDGFESKPEYTFCLYDENRPIKKIHIWDGYLGNIIQTVTPTPNGWTSLAEYYQVCIYFDNDNWKIPDIKSALQQLENIDTSKMYFAKSHEVLEILIEMFKKAYENNLTIYIEYS